MSIDLSKAKIGDKFRTRDGRILKYIGENYKYDDDKYKLIEEDGSIRHFFQYGEYLSYKEDYLDLVEQVFDKPLDELIEEATKQFRENDDAIAEEKECICYYAEKHDSAEIAYVSYIHRTVGLYLEYDEDDENHLLTLNSFDGTEFKIKINYCPFCGRKLTEE